MKLVYTAQVPESALEALTPIARGNRSAVINRALEALVEDPVKIISDAVAHRIEQPALAPKLVKISATIRPAVAQDVQELAHKLHLSANDLIRLAIDSSIRQHQLSHEPVNPLSSVRSPYIKPQ